MCLSSRDRRAPRPKASDLGLEKSTSDARRNIEQGGVELDGAVVRDPKTIVKSPSGDLLIQVGKRRFARVHGSRG